MKTFLPEQLTGRERPQEGRVLNFFDCIPEFERELSASLGEVWMVMHPNYAKSGAADASLRDLSRSKAVDSALPDLLRDKRNVDPVIVFEEDINEPVAAKNLANVVAGGHKNLYKILTTQGNLPVLPEHFQVPNGDYWGALIGYFKQLGMNRVRAAGMFLRANYSGCLGDLVKHLERNGLGVIISDYITPASRKDFKDPS